MSHPVSTVDVSTVDVTSIADGLAAASVPWDIGVAEPPRARQFERILVTDAYDAWLIYWPPGSGIDTHDHGDSTGAIAIVTGTLEEDVAVQGVTVTKRIQAGEVLFLPSGHVHAVRNRTDRTATSVHVYSPPLRSMAFYREGEGGLVLDRIEDTDK